jgi:hypothetical protein
MSDEVTIRSTAEWLEVTGRGEDRTVHCPRQDCDTPLHTCLGCPRYESLAMDPAGKHVYIDCHWEGPGSPAGGG